MRQATEFLQGRWAAVALLRAATTPEQVEAAKKIIDALRYETGYFNPLYTIPEEVRDEITAALRDPSHPLQP